MRADVDIVCHEATFEVNAVKECCFGLHTLLTDKRVYSASHLFVCIIGDDHQLHLISREHILVDSTNLCVRVRVLHCSSLCVELHSDSDSFS